MAIDCTKHPCFDHNASQRFGRVHLPVAPKCNLGCNFCNRKFDCLNESRPGVTSTVLSPRQALAYLRRVSDVLDTPISVVGIAGPGDPFANADETMETLRLVRREFPDMILCVASNGLGIGPHIAELAELETTHVTITINAVDPRIGERVYRFVKPGKRVYRGLVGAQLLLGRQLDAVRQLHEAGVTVKVNSIVMPGINDHHIGEIAATVSALGADVHNCMGLIPVEGTPFAELVEPDDAAMAAARDASGEYLPQMKHCSRCRADAVGLLGEDNDALVQQALHEASELLDDAEACTTSDEHESAEPRKRQRPYIAVASFEGVLVNQHLGACEQVWVFGPAPGQGGGYKRIETRPTPIPGGLDRWAELARRLHDCRALVCANAGQKPKVALAAHGIRVLVAEGLIDEALDAVYAGRKPRMPARVLQPASGCDDDGVGCGGCTGSGTGCG